MELDPSRLILRQEALAHGYTDADIRRLRANGCLSLGHGAYVDRAHYDGLDRIAQHRLLIDALMPALSTDAVLSHQSAAVQYEWALWAVDLGTVHLTRDRPNGGRKRADHHIRGARLLDKTPHLAGGYPVTSPARTVVDLGLTLPFEQAVVIGDHALQIGAVHKEALTAELEFAVRRKGAANARRVIAFLDGRSESVGESRSRVMFDRARLPRPEQQVEIGEWRVDFLWDNVIGEFDGRVKYGRFLRPGQDPGDAVFEEKLREDALWALGFAVVRWTWADLNQPAAIVTRLRAAIGAR